MRWAAAVALILAGCTSTHYMECTTTPIPTTYLQECGATLPHTDSYIQSFIAVMSESTLPQNVPGFTHLLSRTRLVWQDQPFTAPETTGRLRGLTYPPNPTIRMYVLAPPCADLSCTSLGHELLHLWLYAATGDLYAGHATRSAQWPPYYQHLLTQVRLNYLRQMYGYAE